MMRTDDYFSFLVAYDNSVIDISIANGTSPKFWLSPNKLQLPLLVFSFQLKRKTISINGKQKGELTGSQTYKKVLSL